MAAHLFTGQPPPSEYVEMVLMREFGWTWHELQATPSAIVMGILTMKSAEGKYHG